MWGPGGFSCIVRFICHVPTAMGGIPGLNNYNRIKNLGDDFFAALPHGHDLLVGSKIVGMLGTFAFAWNFFQFAVSPFTQGLLLAVIGLIDMGLAVALAIGVARQGQFVASNQGQCDGAADWKNATDGRNLFVMLVEAEHFEEPNAACSNFTLTWIMTIVVVVFYFIVAIFNILIGCAYLANGRYGTETSWGSFPRVDFPAAISRPLGEWVLQPLVKCMAEPFFEWIVMPIVTVLTWGFKAVRGALSHSYGAIRFTVRLCVRLHRMRKRRVPRPPKQSNDPPKQMSDPPSTTTVPLEKKVPTRRVDVKVLPFELATKIAEDLHYSDLLYASRASPRLRMTLFGIHDPDARIEALRQTTCNGQPKSTCEICTNPVCNTCCATNIKMLPSLTIRHVQECRPHCTPCFYKTRCRGRRKPQWPRYTSHPEWCYVFQPVNERRQGYLHRWVDPSERGPQPVRACRPCAGVPERERELAAEARDREAARCGTGVPGSCRECNVGFSKGQIVWWLCEECKAECPNDLHPFRWEWPSTGGDLV